MNTYTIKWEDGSPNGQKGKIKATNVALAWNRFCRAKLGYVSDQSPRFRDVIKGQKTWTVSSFGQHHDPDKNVAIITTPFHQPRKRKICRSATRAHPPWTPS